MLAGRNTAFTVSLLNPASATFVTNLSDRLKAKDTVFWIPYDPTFSVYLDGLGNINGLASNAPNANAITEAIAGVYAMILKGFLKPAYSVSGNILNWTTPSNYGYLPINFHHNYNFTGNITIVLAGYPNPALVPVLGLQIPADWMCTN